jgi:hypothetical protein
MIAIRNVALPQGKNRKTTNSAVAGRDRTAIGRQHAHRDEQQEQPVRDLPDAQARVMQIGDLDPLVLRQEPRANLTHRQPLQRRYRSDDLTVAVSLVTA